jgi:hypothetical protein
VAGVDDIADVDEGEQLRCLRLREDDEDGGEGTVVRFHRSGELVGDQILRRRAAINAGSTEEKRRATTSGTRGRGAHQAASKTSATEAFCGVVSEVEARMAHG